MEGRAFAIFSPGFLPGILTKSDRASLIVLGTSVGLMAGIFEELGWTVFVIPRMKIRYNILTTGLIVGFLWCAWHLLINFWTSGGTDGKISLILLLHSLIFSVGILPAFRVLMVLVYDRTESLFIGMLMHLSLTMSNVIFVPSKTGVNLVIWFLVLAAALWVRATDEPAQSAGTHPADRVRPGAVAAGHRAGLDLSGAVPRSIDAVDTSAAQVVTVCDRAHEELDTDPGWWHWSVPDPVEHDTDDAYDAALSEIASRIMTITRRSPWN